MKFSHFSTGRTLRLPGLKMAALSLGVVLMLLLPLIVQAAAIPSIVDLSQDGQNVVIRGDDVDGYLSEITTTADYNNDGVDDLFIGAAGHNRNGHFSGAAYLFLGGALPASIDLATNPQAANLTIYGAGTNDVFGHSVTGGDVNGDGRTDMIVAADNAGSSRGQVYVFLSTPGLFSQPRVIDLKAPGAIRPALIVKGEMPGGRFGRAISSGDINNDGFDDIVVGSYQASPGITTTQRLEAGAVYVIMGSAAITNTLPLTYQIDPTHPVGVKIYGEAGDTDGVNAPNVLVPAAADRLLLTDELAPQAGELGDRLGRSVYVGDVNNDGIDDVLAGAYGANIGSKMDAGKAYVFYGDTSYQNASPTVFDLSSDPTAASVTYTGVDAGDQFGFYVGSGDLNKDSFDDVLVGAYFSKGYNNAAGNETGEVYVFRGGASLPASVTGSSANTIVYGKAGGDRLGRSLAAGDVNGDGYEDLVMGASKADPGGVRVDAGSAFVIYGGASLPASVQLSQPGSASITILGDQSGVACGADPNPDSDCADEAGFSTATGDINGDGYHDLIVGAIYANNGVLLQDAGATYLIYGGVQGAHGDAVGVTLSPKTFYADTGQQVGYVLMARDANNVTWEVTSAATFSISAGAGGSWSGNYYTTGNAGTWTVTAAYQSLSDTASLIVAPPHTAPTSITLAPDNATTKQNEQVTYNVTAKDAGNVTWNVTGLADYGITAGAGGSWSGPVYTPEIAGSWTVTATYLGLQDTTGLTVTKGLSMYLPVVRAP